MAKDEAKKTAAELKAAEAKKAADAKAEEAKKMAEKAAKDAQKAKEKAAKDAEVAAAKALKDAQKEAEKAEKAAQKEAELAAKEAAKAAKQQEREAIKAQRAAEREARKGQPRPPKPWEDLPAGAMQQAPREGSVLHKCLELIKSNGGATLEEMQAAIGEKHSIRKLLTWGNRERGYGFTMVKATGKIKAIAPNVKVPAVPTTVATPAN